MRLNPNAVGLDPVGGTCGSEACGGCLCQRTLRAPGARRARFLRGGPTCTGPYRTHTPGCRARGSHASNSRRFEPHSASPEPTASACSIHTSGDCGSINSHAQHMTANLTAKRWRRAELRRAHAPHTRLGTCLHALMDAGVTSQACCANCRPLAGPGHLL